MADNDFNITVNRPAEEVFNLISDIPNYSDWVPSNSNYFIESKVTSTGPVGLGTTFEDRLTLGKNVGKVVEYQPFERLVFEQKWYPESHAWVMRIEYHFEPANGDTKINRKVDVTPAVWAEPLMPMVDEMERDESQRTCEAIKKTLEQKT
jgi:uncharacterized protein YndB with AHSA1/START domain